MSANDASAPTVEAFLNGSQWHLLVALGIGLLIGLERERRKGHGPDREAAGVRTFALVALLGGLCAAFGGVAVLAVCAAFIAVAGLAAYTIRRNDDPGLTTQVALMTTFLLGALTSRDAALAAALAVIVAVLLVARTLLHRFVRDSLSEQEVHDGLIFATAALVVLPFVPNDELGPYGVFNPFVIWRLVVIVMAIGAVGYAGIRLFGARLGLAVADSQWGSFRARSPSGSLECRRAEMAACCGAPVPVRCWRALQASSNSPSLSGQQIPRRFVPSPCRWRWPR